MYKALEFNTVTNLIDVVSQFDPSLVYPLTPPQGSVIPAATGLSNGNLVTLIDSGGTIQATPSNASASCAQAALPAHGFVLANFTAAEDATVFLAGLFTAAVPSANVTNIGDLVYLSSSTPGGCSLTPPLPTSWWMPNHMYSGGEIIVDTNGNWETASAGTSGPTEPASWTLTCGHTTMDNTVTWTMSPPALEQVVGTIVFFNAASGLCTIDFQPMSNVGDVTSVGLSMPADFSVANSPILTAGTIAVAWLPQAAHLFHAGPASGSPAVPAWRAIAIADLFSADGVTTTNFLSEAGTWLPVSAVTVSSDHPGLVASLGPVTLLTPAATGMYRVSVYEECTVAGASGGGQPFGDGVFGSGVFNMGDDSVQVSVSWTDDVGPRSDTPVPLPLDLGATNAASGDLFIRAAAGHAITFTAALAATGSPTYGVFVRLETV